MAKEISRINTQQKRTTEHLDEESSKTSKNKKPKVSFLYLHMLKARQALLIDTLRAQELSPRFLIQDRACIYKEDSNFFMHPVCNSSLPTSHPTKRTSESPHIPLQTGDSSRGQERQLFPAPQKRVGYLVLFSPSTFEERFLCRILTIQFRTSLSSWTDSSPQLEEMVNQVTPSLASDE